MREGVVECWNDGVMDGWMDGLNLEHRTRNIEQETKNYQAINAIQAWLMVKHSTRNPKLLLL